MSTLPASTQVKPAAQTCPHFPPCPPADAADHDAAHVVFHDEIAGYSLLCNGVIVFADTGELLPNGTAVKPHRPEGPHHTLDVFRGDLWLDHEGDPWFVVDPRSDDNCLFVDPQGKQWPIATVVARYGPLTRVSERPGAGWGVAS